MNSIESLEENRKRSSSQFSRIVDEDCQSISLLENLSNEMFYEIFDYLEGEDLYQAFSNVNDCFDQLLRSPFLRWKIEIDWSKSEIFLENYKQMIFLHKDQVYSIRMGLYSKSDEILLSFIIDSSLQHLEAFFIHGGQSDHLISLLRNLSSFPRLFSLIVDIGGATTNPNDIYPVILALPVLKCAKLAFYKSSDEMTFPVATNEQLTSIEDLHLDEFCTFDELARILSYTPQLRRLNFSHTEDDDDDGHRPMVSCIRLPNLTHLTIDDFDSTFDQLEMLIKNLQCTLKFLHLTTKSNDLTYLDVNRWEEFLRRDLPQLDQFKFRYHQCIGDGTTVFVDLEETNQFASSFWIGRQLVFEAVINSEEIIYSIHPYKKRSFEDLPHQINKSSRMILADVPFDDYELNFLINDIGLVLQVAQIYHLVVLEDKISTDALIEILLKLPDLLSIKILSLSLENSETPFLKEEIAIQLSSTSKITAVLLEEMNDIDEVDFLIELCPQLNYLQLNRTKCMMDIEVFVESIIMKISEGNQHLQYFSFCSSEVDDQTVEQLERMCDSNVPLFDYTVKRLDDDNIVLRWN